MPCFAAASIVRFRCGLGGFCSVVCRSWPLHWVALSVSVHPAAAARPLLLPTEFFPAPSAAAAAVAPKGLCLVYSCVLVSACLHGLRRAPSEQRHAPGAPGLCVCCQVAARGVSQCLAFGASAGSSVLLCWFRSLLFSHSPPRSCACGCTASLACGRLRLCSSWCSGSPVYAVPSVSGSPADARYARGRTGCAAVGRRRLLLFS